jgi:spore germination cell wall hydrolase CwlJ-like protein
MGAVASIMIEATRPVPIPATTTDVPAVSFSVPKHVLTSLERETIAACLILEAASQGDFGMRGVMAVIRNRSRGLPELYAPVVLRPKQFSALNRITTGGGRLSDAITRAKRDRMWATALRIVDDAVDDAWHDPTNGATHYTRSSEKIYWTRSLTRTAIIGAHSFYR